MDHRSMGRIQARARMNRSEQGIMYFDVIIEWTGPCPSFGKASRFLGYEIINLRNLCSSVDTHGFPPVSNTAARIPPESLRQPAHRHKR